MGSIRPLGTSTMEKLVEPSPPTIEPAERMRSAREKSAGWRSQRSWSAVLLVRAGLQDQRDLTCKTTGDGSRRDAGRATNRLHVE